MKKAGQIPHNIATIFSSTGTPAVFLHPREADYVVPTRAPTEVCPLGLIPTTSTTVFTVIGDALVVLMMEIIGFTRRIIQKGIMADILV
jgi:D-arabinose 5-phosphate isomerase GutQ